MYDFIASVCPVRWTLSWIYNLRSRCAAYVVQSGTIGMPEHENIVFALGILLVSGLQRDIHVLPVLAATISDFRLYQQNFKDKNWILNFIYCCATSVLYVLPEFEMSLQTDPCLKQRKYKTFTESDLNVIMPKFISQGRDSLSRLPAPPRQSFIPPLNLCFYVNLSPLIVRYTFYRDKI